MSLTRCPMGHMYNARRYGKICPYCQNNTFTTFWRGYIVVINPEESEIAKKMGVEKAGKFALRLSR